jgi:hypothetical protein
MKKSGKKTPASGRKSRQRFRGAPCSAWDRFQSAIKTVIRNLGGTRQFLLASGYVPSEWLGCKPGFWVSPHNRNIMWRANDAVQDQFTRFRWHGRAEAAKAKYMPNTDYANPVRLSKSATREESGG